MSRRTVWFALLHGREERDAAAPPAHDRAPSPLPALLRGRWRVDDDDDVMNFPAAPAMCGPYIEVTE